MRILSLLLITSLNLFASEFTKGSGSEFSITFENAPKTNLSIYITESSFNKLGVEYYFKTKSILSQKMWQQFILKNSGDAPLSIESGFVYAPDFDQPEILTDKYLNMNKGVEVTDFLFSKESEINKFKIGVETIEIPAGTLSATHYRKEKNGQVVDFWITDIAKPIGLVKLVSKSKNKNEQNYTIELEKLLTNVKAKIDPSAAKPLSKKGKGLLGEK